MALVATTVSAVLTPMQFASAQSEPPYGFFYSDQTGYFFFWKSSFATEEERSSEPGTDLIRLTDSGASLSYWAYQTRGETTTDCVRANIGSLEDVADIVAVEALAEDGGPPRIARGASDMVVTSEGSEKYAVRMECREIVPGQSMLFTTTIVPARVYNEHNVPLDVYARTYISYFDFAELRSNGRSFAIPGASDGDTFTVGTICLEHEFFVLAHASREGDGLQFYTSSFATFDEAGQPLPTDVTWYHPDSQRASVVVQPGETGIFHVVAVTDSSAGGANVAYVTPSGEAYDLRLDSEDTLVGCGTGGGGAPVLIDID
jgi:hypothetical protein